MDRWFKLAIGNLEVRIISSDEPRCGDAEFLLIKKRDIIQWIKNLLEDEAPPQVVSPPSYFYPHHNIYTESEFMNTLHDLGLKISIMTYSRTLNQLLLDIIIYYTERNRKNFV